MSDEWRGDIMKTDVWLEDVYAGALNDYDGWGYLLAEDKKETENSIVPSYAYDEKKFNEIIKYPYVEWINK